MRSLFPVVALFVLACTPPEPKGKTQTTEPDPTVPTVPTVPTEPTTPTGPSGPLPLVILNEVMPGSGSWLNGPDGDSLPDWIEIVNLDTTAIAMDRLTLRNDDGDEWTGEAGTEIAPGERVLVYAGVDDTVGGPLFTGWSLDKGSDKLTLLGDGFLIDFLDIDDVGGDISMSRIPDLTGPFTLTAWATPGLENGPEASPTLDPAGETVFLKTIVHQIEFTFTEQAYDQINLPERPEVHVEMAMDGVHYPDIGLKLKGSASYDTMDGKPAFLVDINQWVPGTKFRGLKAFKLHNGNVLDPTRTRDWLSYKLAREAGIKAPRVGWAEVYCNGQYFGIYMVIERHDDVFIEYHAPGQQDLAMVFEPNESEGTGFGWGDFGTGSITFNYEEGPDPMPDEAQTALLSADQLISQSATDERVAELWNHVNKDQFLRYMAWEAVVMHTDGYKSPNNWRIWLDGYDFRIEWLPSGAEWTWDSVAAPWSFGGNAADWCIQNQGCKHDYAEHILVVADLADALDLVTEFTDLSTWLDPLIEADPRYSAWQTVDQARSSTLIHLTGNPETARQEVYQDFPDLIP